MLNSKGLRKLQNKLGLKKLAKKDKSKGDYQVLVDQNTGVAVLVDREGKFVYFPKPTDTNSPLWALYLFLVNYNNRLNNPYGVNEEGGVPIVIGADILGSLLRREYLNPNDPQSGAKLSPDETHSQVRYYVNEDNPVNLLNVIKNLAFADAEFRGMHFGSNMSSDADPRSGDFSEIFSVHKPGEASRSGLMTHLNLSVIDPENTNTTIIHPLHDWYPSEIEDDLRLRGYPEHLIASRRTGDFDTVVGRAAESPIDTVRGGYSLASNQLWSWVSGEDTDYMKAMRELERKARVMENENRFSRFVPMHQQAAYRTLRELERRGQVKDPFFVNGNMFYIEPTTVTEDGDEYLIWNPKSTFIDLANRKDLELINIENALTNEAALTEAINAINATMYEGSQQPTFSSPEAQLLFKVLDNNRREFYLLEDPKILEDGRKLLYDVDKMPAAYRSMEPYYSTPKTNLWQPSSSVSAEVTESLNKPRALQLQYRIPSLTDFALFLNEDVDDYTGRVFVDSAGRQFVTQSDDLPYYNHTSDHLDPVADKEAYDAINGANLGWLNRKYGLYRTYNNPYALLVTGGILESAYLRKRDSDQLLEILGGLGDADINYGIEAMGNRNSTRPTPYLYHYYSYMGFDPSTTRVPTDGKIFGIQLLDNPNGTISMDSLMNSDRVRHMRTLDFSHDYELWAYNAGKWVQQHAVETLGGSKSDGKILGEIAQLGVGIFNPQMFGVGIMESPVAWMDGTGYLQNLVNFDRLSRLYGVDLTIKPNADRVLNSDAFWTLNSAYLNPNSMLAGTPQDILGDVATIPFIRGGAKTLNVAWRGGKALWGKMRGTPPVTPSTLDVVTGPVIKGNRPSVLNDLSSTGNLKLSQSGASLVGEKPMTLWELESRGVILENGKGAYMPAIDLENAVKAGVDVSAFYKPGETLTLHASPSEVAVASNGLIPASGFRGVGSRALDLMFLGGTLPDTVFNVTKPIITYRGMRYNAAKNAARGNLLKYEPFKWEQLFGKSGPRRSNTFTYDPKTNKVVQGKPVEGLIGVNGGYKWDPRTWVPSLIYDGEGNMRPIWKPIIGRLSFSRLNSFTIPHMQANIDPRLYPNHRYEIGELVNTAGYYTPDTYNTTIDEYANNDYINKTKRARDGLNTNTSVWPWMAVGGAGLGLGLLLSNRKKEEEEKKKRKRRQYMLRLLYGQGYGPY